MKHRETTKCENARPNAQTKSFHTALQLARMYGVAETLHPIPFLPTEEFILQIERWAAEYESQKGGDILAFFEEKMLQKKQNRES